MEYLSTTNTTAGVSTPWAENTGFPNRSERQFQHYINTLETYVYPVICALGCLGNGLCLIVLNKGVFRKSDGGKETSAHIALSFLAGSDLFFCVCLFPRCLLTSHESLFESRSFLLYYQIYGTGLITTFLLASTWVTVAMATMRYLAICYPLQARTVDGPYCARVLFTIVFILAVLLNLPTFWMYKWSQTDYDHQTYYVLDIGYIDYNQPRGQAYLWVKLLTGTILPALVLLYCNAQLIRALRRSNRLRRQFCATIESHHARSRNRTTFMLVVIVTMFFFFVFPSEIMDFFIIIIKEDYQRTELFLLLRAIANLLQVINFTFNFALYCTINVHFRIAAHDLVMCAKNGHMALGQSTVHAPLSYCSSRALVLRNGPGSLRAVESHL